MWRRGWAGGENRKVFRENEREQIRELSKPIN